MAAVVEVVNLSKIYRSGDTEVFALDDVTITIEAGEFVVLMGPSGSGKSTLLHIIAGIDRPTKGECRVMGTDITALSEGRLAAWRNANIGFVFQSFNLVPVLSALENVELPLLLTGLGASERRRHAKLALDLVGLADRMHHRPRQLSGGQEQRVAIARALVTDPPFIVADEPTGNLDAKSATEVLTLLKQLSREGGKTVVMVTHDPKAAVYGTRILHLEKGELERDERMKSSEELPVAGAGH
ncbi:MAG: ABC transporter ATP-binding protein [Candidatus Sumerlaeia bacterium]|nr:ABC transporter ATP-binding protein [Candidatus Sumerlaeia bacterium]